MDTVIELGNVALRSFGIYLIFMLVMRFFGQKEIGNMNLHDLVLIFLLVESIGPVILGDKVTPGTGLVGFFTIFLTNKLVNHLMFHFGGIRRKLDPTPKLIIRNGQIMKEVLSSLKMTEPEVYRMLREKGILNPDRVAYGIIESDGELSVISEDNSPSQTDKRISKVLL